MAGLDYEKGPADRDPARISSEEIAAQSGLSDREIKSFRGAVARSAAAKTKPIRTARVSFDPSAAVKLKTLSGKIKFIRRGGKVDANPFIHDVALAVIRHINESGHGDCSHAGHLVGALPSLERSRQLARWNRWHRARC